MNGIMLGVVGIKGYSNYTEFKEAIDKWLSPLHLKVDTIVFGGGNGVDALAEKYADENNVKKIIHKLDHEKRISRKELFERNNLIVNDSEIILAFWDTKSRIVLDAIRKTAKEFEKDFFIEWV